MGELQLGFVQLRDRATADGWSLELEVRRWQPQATLEFLRRPLEFLHAFQTALNQHAADMLRAMSSARPITRLAFRPGAGSSSYMVTTGPGRTATISPFTP